MSGPPLGGARNRGRASMEIVWVLGFLGVWLLLQLLILPRAGIST